MSDARRSVGQTARGSLSGVLTKRLPNGWLITPSNEVYLDSNGKAREGSGIPPTIPITIFSRSDEDAAQTHLQAVRDLVDHIRLQ